MTHPPVSKNPITVDTDILALYLNMMNPGTGSKNPITVDTDILALNFHLDLPVFASGVDLPVFKLNEIWNRV